MTLFNIIGNAFTSTFKNIGHELKTDPLGTIQNTAVNPLNIVNRLEANLLKGSVLHRFNKNPILTHPRDVDKMVGIKHDKTNMRPSQDLKNLTGNTSYKKDAIEQARMYTYDHQYTIAPYIGTSKIGSPVGMHGVKSPATGVFRSLAGLAPNQPTEKIIMYAVIGGVLYMLMR